MGDQQPIATGPVAYVLNQEIRPGLLILITIQGVGATHDPPFFSGDLEGTRTLIPHRDRVVLFIKLRDQNLVDQERLGLSSTTLQEWGFPVKLPARRTRRDSDPHLRD